MDNQTPDKYERIPRQSFRDLDRKGKIQYILDYYSLHIIGGAVLLAVIISIAVYFGFQYRRTQLYALCVNATAQQADLLTDDYAAYAGFNTRKYTLAWDDNGYVLGEGDDYNIYLKITTLVGANETDVFVFSDKAADYLRQLGILADLKETLPDTLYAYLDAEGLLLTGLTPEYDEEDEPAVPYPFAIDITDTAFAARYGLRPAKGERLYLSLSVSTRRAEEAVQFVRFVCQEISEAE